jgi:hypothetical protein
MPIVVRSQTMTVTLNLRPGSAEKADTQVTIRDPERAVYQQEIHRAVTECEKRLEPRAQERAQAFLLTQVAQGGAEVKRARGSTNARNAYPDGLVVLHVHDLVRVGQVRFLLFSIQNTNSDNFDVRGIRFYVDGREVPITFALAPPGDPSRVESGPSMIFPKEERQGALALPANMRGGAVRTRVVVEEANPKRNIELNDLEVP